MSNAPGSFFSTAISHRRCSALSVLTSWDTTSFIADQLHRDLAKVGALQEFMLYDMTTKPEYEANIVAAEILLDTDEVLDYVYNFGYTSEQIAKAMSTDINLVALKVAHLAESNRGLRPIEHRADFLKGD